MTTDTFRTYATQTYNKLIKYLVARGYEQADAEDYVGQWVVWGLEKEWEANEVHGFNDAVTRLRNFIRDDNARLCNKNEMALGFEQDADEYTEACDYDFSHLFTETNERTQDEFSDLALSIIGGSETAMTTQAISERLAILTDRQRDIVYLAEQGMSQAEIATHLGVDAPAVSKLISRAIERIYDAYPELQPWGQAWTKEEIKAQHEETARLSAMYEYETPAVNHVGFAFDKYEDTTRKCLSNSHLCTLHTHYTTDTPEVSTVSERKLDAFLSANCNQKVVSLSKEEGLELLSVSPDYDSRPAPWHQEQEQDTEKLYYLGANRLFNSLGLGRDIGEATMATLRRLILNK